ncbi:MAG: iron-containing alcohol dehydrogenase family protein [Lachnospiraceae bacterium]|nr:iron-containing alcohol dehydrogenase family protein [Lachnospiraceae bacterium]MDD7669588.1 iron-containing alcohol dehydrogenase family protein [Lachnospiraceae bacterium]MDY2619056.1 iron-containing alcohol dehydrogenase family protein [Agathobacter sp.]
MGDNHIAIPALLKIGPGALGELGTYLKDLRLEKVVILFGNGLIEMFGMDVMKSLAEMGIDVLEYQELDTVRLEDLTSLAFSMPAKTQAVIGIGGGKVIDAAKYCGFLRNLAFISIPTSASSDGFSSASASLLVEGRRKSVPARLAYGIVVDTQIIKSAPKKFIYSGIGDMVSKITALYDWKFEEEHGYGKVNDFATMIAKKAVNSFVRTPFESIEEDLFIKELLDSLAMSGIANEIAGSSAPTSGSEHLISHALDKMLEQPQLHGIQVGIATYLMSVVQDHRYKRVNTIFTQTGFWDFVKTLEMRHVDFEQAIDLAPSIKPFRHTYLHEQEYRDRAKEVLVTDEKLKEILV